MKGEIRGLFTGEYLSKEGDILLEIFIADDGVHIVQTDFEMDDMRSEWILAGGKVIKNSLEYIEYDECDEDSSY